MNLINKQTTTAQSIFWNRCFTAWKHIAMETYKPGSTLSNWWKKETLSVQVWLRNRSLIPGGGGGGGGGGGEGSRTTSRSWQCNSSHCDTCSNHLAISDFLRKCSNALLCYLRGLRWLQMHVPSDRLMPLMTDIFSSGTTYYKSTAHPKFDWTGCSKITFRLWQYSSSHWDTCQMRDVQTDKIRQLVTNRKQHNSSLNS